MRRLLALSPLIAAGCAWSNPDNRPVWNAFEKNVVPSSGVAFYASLPLTVPIGLGAILADTLIVHPACVIDDAAGDAGELWDDLDWRNRYYTQLGFLPLRVAATPLTFVGAFLGRACFDIPPRDTRDPAEKAASAERDAAASRALCLEFFAAIERRENANLANLKAAPAWDAELDQAFARALRAANGPGRHRLFRVATQNELPPLVREPWLGLRDADPVVRYFELQAWPADKELPAGLRADLLADPNEMVRLLAKARLR